MKYKLILILGMIQLLLVNIPVFALNCNKTFCHPKCINSQPASVQTKCRCDLRRGVKYNVPEYDKVCDGTFEEYKAKYCAAKQRYDNEQSEVDYIIYHTNRYTPAYDSLCDGSYAEYMQKIQGLKQIQALNNYSDALRNQRVQVNGSVYHSGNVNQNVNFNGSMYHY